MPLKPRLADVNCTPMRFRPGDRILVKIYQPLDKDARQKLIRSVAKWARLDEEAVFIVNGLIADIEVEHHDPNQIIIPGHTQGR